MAVRQDVRGVQETRMTKAAHGARRLVGAEDSFAEVLLVKSLHGGCGDVSAPPGSQVFGDCRPARESEEPTFIDGHSELELCRRVADHESRPSARISARHEASQVDD